MHSHAADQSVTDEEQSVSQIVTEHKVTRSGLNAADRLIKRENNAVTCLRVWVFVVLLVVGAVAATAIYISISTIEQNSFEHEVETVSANVLRAFQNDLRLKFFMAQTVSAAISGAIEATSSQNFNMSVAQFEEIVHSLRFLDQSRAIYWAPYLRSHDERDNFVEFANSTIQVNSTRAFPPCYFCGSSNLELKDKMGTLEVLGGQNFQCGGIEDAALSGVISPDRCNAGKASVSEACGCKLKDGIGENEVVAANRTFADGLFKMDTIGAVDDESEPPYHPIWQIAGSAETIKSAMYNQQTEPRRAEALQFMVESKLPVISQTYIPNEPFHQAYGRETADPTTLLFFPIFGKQGMKGDVIGSLTQEIEWKSFVTSVYPPGSEDMDIVISNSCNQTYTFRVGDFQTTTGQNILVVRSEGDTHDPKYSSFGHFRTFDDYDIDRYFAATGLASNSSSRPDDKCRYAFAVYPTEVMEGKYKTSTPLMLAVAAAGMIAFAAIMFLIYDRIVNVRQRKIMQSARETSAIVDSLFPENVRSRLLVNSQGADAQQTGDMGSNSLDEDLGSDPIADLFPATTIMFLDIQGFTAWASEREPTQVFKLLETVYKQFDEVARTMGVFKVETIGDSYVAVAGLPEPRPDHAVVMARFALTCMKRFRVAVRRLEIQLGPSTAELKSRCGLHSGPVTGGVLRGDKARFQLFGTTMNTASRMESTGVADKIQVSEETARLLREDGRTNWLELREDQIVAKGLGQLTTYFLEQRRVAERRMSNLSIAESLSLSSLPSAGEESSENSIEIPFWEAQSKRLSRKEMERAMRLVDWNVETLYQLLVRIVARRLAIEEISRRRSRRSSNFHATESQPRNQLPPSTESSLTGDQVVEVIPILDFDADIALRSAELAGTVSLDEVVREELRNFVASVASMYRDNPFHSFDHASHVAMSATKLLKRIVSPRTNDKPTTPTEAVNMLEDLHNSTYGISSDPVMQFTAVFAALIHDLDHSGLSNQELVRMQTPSAVAYGNRSVAEKNSLDLAWAMLATSPEFSNLRRAIYTTTTERDRFRQILVNVVMATDIADKGLQQKRKERWNRAFSPEETPDNSRRATIVMDYIIQASDVSHTMQHFLTYRKWNERLFAERYRAWKAGHDHNPCESWYEGEIGFFDHYVIPLAMKLKECGVFGVSHDEFLNYARINREEWQNSGREITTELVQREQRESELKAKSYPDDLDESSGDEEEEQPEGTSSGPEEEADSNSDTFVGDSPWKPTPLFVKNLDAMVAKPLEASHEQALPTVAPKKVSNKAMAA